jgi:hypothetical protein
MWASFTSVRDDSVGTGKQQTKAEIHVLAGNEIAKLPCGLVLIC